MSQSRTPVMTGGCQCGAVRYALYAAPQGPHICHCRMCQKAFGSYFAPLAGVALADFAWTRGQPKVFNSSDIVERGFCADCGTPLTFAYRGTDRISLSVGSFDAPARLAPVVQYFARGRLPWIETLAGLPARAEDEITHQGLIERVKASNHQHPDRDTEAWEPRASTRTER